MRGDVGDLLVEFRMKVVAGRVADQPRARAVTALRRTTIRHQKQNAVGITMHESRHGRVRIFAARVAHFPRRGVRFLDARHDLLAYVLVRPEEGSPLAQQLSLVWRLLPGGSG